jgi:hypothetical protein
VICPCCSAPAIRTPFQDKFEDDEEVFYYLAADRDSSAEVYDGDVERWECTMDKGHVFYLSTGADEEDDEDERREDAE